MHLIDTHCHLELYEAPEDIIAGAEEKGIYTIAMTNLPSSFNQLELLLSGKKYLRPALGLHPQNSYQHHSQLALMFDLMHRTRYIGEIGLDYSTGDIVNRRFQRRVFTRILEECSASGDKILSVHSRCAAEDVNNAIGANFPGKVILHWYSGSNKELKRAISNGYYFSINPAMIRSKKGAALISMMPIKHLLTESDGPYVKIDRQDARPDDMGKVVASIATLFRKEMGEFENTIYANFKQLISGTYV